MMLDTTIHVAIYPRVDPNGIGGSGHLIGEKLNFNQGNPRSLAHPLWGQIGKKNDKASRVQTRTDYPRMIVADASDDRRRR